MSTSLLQDRWSQINISPRSSSILSEKLSFRHFCILKYRSIKLAKAVLTMRETCPNTEFLLVLIFPHSDWIRRDSPYLSVFSPNAGKYEPEKSPYLDSFHAVLWTINLWVQNKITTIWSLVFHMNSSEKDFHMKTLVISNTRYLELFYISNNLSAPLVI